MSQTKWVANGDQRAFPCTRCISLHLFMFALLSTPSLGMPLPVPIRHGLTSNGLTSVALYHKCLESENRLAQAGDVTVRFVQTLLELLQPPLYCLRR
jgi:hypothetical protein